MPRPRGGRRAMANPIGVTPVDVEGEAEARAASFAEALGQLRQVLPGTPAQRLKAALRVAGGDVERAVDSLIELTGSAAGAEPQDPEGAAGAPAGGAPLAASPAVSLADGGGGQEWTEEAVDDDGPPEAAAETEGQGRVEFAAAARSMERILPDCEPAHLRVCLEEANGDPNVAVERILASSESYPRRSSATASSSFEPGASSSSSAAGGAAPPCGVVVNGRGSEYWLETKSRETDDQSLGPTKKNAYGEEAMQLLQHEFGEFGKPGLSKVFQQSGRAYAIAWKRCYESLDELLAGRPLSPPLVQLRCPRKSKEDVNALSLKSLKCVRLREEFDFVRRYRRQGREDEERKAAREVYLKECEANGLLLECECCYDEFLAEEVLQCAAGHLFCQGCAKRYIENMLTGEACALTLACPSTSGCRAVLPVSELRRVLPEGLMGTFEKMQAKTSIEAVLLRGGLQHLERCPFCDFAMEMELDREENIIFVCQAEGCGKESCRLCHKESHIPMKCEDKAIEKAKEDYRLTVEESMSQALIRECPACKSKGIVSKFVKADGCNRMTCPKCQGWVCYQCSQQIPKKVGYGHFCQHPRNPDAEGCERAGCNKCDLWSGTEADLAQAEAKRVATAGRQASAEYREAHADQSVDEAELDVLRAAEKTKAPRKGQKRSLPAGAVAAAPQPPGARGLPRHGRPGRRPRRGRRRPRRPPRRRLRHRRLRQSSGPSVRVGRLPRWTP